MMKYFIALLFPLVLHSQKHYTDRMDQLMQAKFEVEGFSGTALVMQKGEKVYHKAFGLADREWNVPNTPETKYRIGSVTKQFTAACILKLEEEGKLKITDKLSLYFPDFPKGDSITIHMLLNHSSGIKNYTSIPEFWPKAVLPLPPDSMVAVFKNKPFDFSPGSRWSYSNSGYYLLGLIVEKASGQKFHDFLQNWIIEPAGLKNTGMDRLDSILANRAKGYAWRPSGGWRHADYISMEGPYSAGAMFSTVEDLYSWEKALMSNKILYPGSVVKMTTPYLGNYGYGLSIDSLHTHPRIWHNGGIPGFSAHLAHYPQDDLYIAVLSNNQSSADRAGIGLASILFDQAVYIPYLPKEIYVDPKLLDRYTGKYQGTNLIEIRREGNALFRHTENSPPIELKAESLSRFFYPDRSGRFLEFEFDTQGRVSKTWFIQNGEKTEMKKVE